MAEEPSSAQQVTDQAQQVASAAARRGKEVVGAAGGEVPQVAEVAREQASQVPAEASAQVAKVLDDAKAHLRDQAQAQTDQLGDALAGLAAQIRAMTEGRPQDAGLVADVACQAAQRVDQVTKRIQRSGFDGLVADMQRYARRRPVTFLAGALAAGLAAGRSVRAGREAGAANAGTDAGTTERSSASADPPSPDRPDLPDQYPLLEPYASQRSPSGPAQAFPGAEAPR